MLTEQWERIALRHAPRIWIDRNEPFRPVRVGITAFDQSGPSPSFDRMIELDGSRATAAIEYSVYWDYDIQHLYDLEHIWIYLSDEGAVVDCEASFHGRYLKGIAPGRTNVDRDGRVNLYVQPGKHAFSAMRELFELLPDFHAAAGPLAGKDGVLEPGMFGDAFKLPGDDELALAHLRTFRFDISGDYVPYEWSAELFVPWERLKEEIPRRMNELLRTLRATR